jgi:glutamate dehydrogenase (NADP+)
MSQNSLRLSWSSEEVDEKLKGIMLAIHASCVKYGLIQLDMLIM